MVDMTVFDAIDRAPHGGGISFLDAMRRRDKRLDHCCPLYNR
jgi:hypothetical protein